MAAKYLYILLTCIVLAACESVEPSHEENIEHVETKEDVVVLVTDSTEWHVCLFAQHVIYSKAVEVNLPSPWLLPTREDAAILKTCTYPHDERFVTSDGYTFGMPSASVSKAGQKTYYSVLGLWKRPTVIVIDF